MSNAALMRLLAGGGAVAGGNDNEILVGALTEILTGAEVDEGDDAAAVVEALLAGGGLQEILTSGDDQLQRLLAGASTARKPAINTGLLSFVQKAIENRAKADAIVQEKAKLGKKLELRDEIPQRARSNYLPIPPTTVLANADLRIAIAPDTMCKPSRLIVPSTCNADFLIYQVQIGRRPQFPGSDGIPGRMFDEKNTAKTMTYDTWNWGQKFFIHVKNKTDVDAEFEGGFEVDYVD